MSIKRFTKLVGVAVVAVGLLVGYGYGGGGGQFNPNITYGELTDSRDGKKYKTVVIGSQTWMAENLNYKTDNSWCYGNDDSNCAKYGRLYTWDAAMKACPAGWRLPTDAEWDVLINFVAGKKIAGTKLKSAIGWEQHSDTPEGTDDFGFSALPGGFRYSGGSFRYAGYYGYWWTAMEYGAGNAYYRGMYYNFQDVGWGYYLTDYGYSVRCRRN